MLVAVACLSVASASASSGPVSGAGAARLYVAVGDSLASGEQPDTGGQSRRTAEGYADFVAAAERRFYRGLRLRKLGGSETSQTLIYGSGGRGPGRSRLRRAELLMRAHRGRTVLVTVNIGDNDVEQCISPGGIDHACVQRGLRAVERNLPVIGRRLRAAAGRGARVVGIADYNQFWALWLRGPAGRRIASESAHIVSHLNQVMGQSWRRSGVQFADAGPEFHTLAQRRVYWRGRRVPLAVKSICELTWACSRPPVGFNDHANARGYRLIANVVARVIGRLSPPPRRQQ